MSPQSVDQTPEQAPGTRPSLPPARPERSQENQLNSNLDRVRTGEQKLRLGSSGPAVRALQQDLVAAAEKIGISAADIRSLTESREFQNGRFGRRTYEMLNDIQSRLKLTTSSGSQVELVQDGILGPRTQRAIDILLGRSVMDIAAFASLIGNDWTGYDNSSRRMRRYYDASLIPFNENTLNPYFGSQVRISQDRRWNCGPTACAMAVAPLLGVHPGQLADYFTQMQIRIHGARGMDHDNPPKFGDAVGIDCDTLGVVDPRELAARIQRGERVVVSVNPRVTDRGVKLTGGGHIIALGGVTTDENGTLWFENLDPNGKNIRKGFSMLSEHDLRELMAGKNSWAFYPKQSPQPQVP